MSEDENRTMILRAAKDKILQSEMQQRVQLIADAIGERRDRDLLDILSQIEQERGWSEVVEHLMKARTFNYPLPVGTGPINTKVEIIKYREVLFSILACAGLEPVNISINEILTLMTQVSSLIEASSFLRNKIESKIKLQIESGDTLFLNPDDFDTQISEEVFQLINQPKLEQTQEFVLEKKGNEINITPLWQHESTRLILSDYGIKGRIVTLSKIEQVLSVIQIPVTIFAVEKHSLHAQPEYPSNQTYRDLHNYIINQDAVGLCNLSSRQSFPTLKFLLEDALDMYNKNASSENYRKVLNLIHMHIRLRLSDSIPLFEILANLKDSRIATVAITALGNYYNEAAASTLVELLCTNKNREIMKITLKALYNNTKKCPESYKVIANALNSSSCRQKGKLKRLLKELNKKRTLYY